MRSIWTSLAARFKAVPTSVLREWFLLTFLLCAIGGVMARYESLFPLDALYYDLIISSEALPVPNDIALITIEPDTLDRSNLSRRLWDKGDSAELLERLTLGAPAAVLLDFTMSVSDPRDQAGEGRLSDAIKQNGKVVLPIFLQIERGATQGFRLPIPKLANYSVALGHDKTVAHHDGVTRRLPLSITNGDIDWPHVILPLLKTANGFVPDEMPATSPLSKPVGVWREDQYLYLRFIDRSTSFETYTARQILNGEIAPETFRDKIVLIGSSLSDTTVAVPSASRRGRTMWGLELFANAINTLRNDAWPTVTDPSISVPVTVGLIFLTLLSYLVLPDRGAFATTWAAIGAVSLVGWALLGIGDIWFPHASFSVTTAVAYPLWAWRRLSATYRFVGLELNRMRAEPGVAGHDPGLSNSNPAPPTLIDQQLAAIQEATAKLRTARKFVSDIIEGLPIGVVVSNPRGSIVLANIPAVRSVGAATTDDIRGRDLGSVLNEFRGVDGHSLVHIDWTADHSRELAGPNGERYWLACRQIADEGGNRVGAIVALADISALRKVEEQREELLRFLSHDMRSPLASILALIELRSESAELSSDNERFEEIKRYARHTLSLAEEFLQLAYATTSNPDEFEAMDLAQAAEMGIDLVRPLARERRVRIAQQLPESAAMRGNHNLVGRMLANLVHNAVKFSPTDSTITVTVERDNDEWLCKVRDNGKGIAADEMPRLFEPYRRMRGGKNEGTGLGLTFVLVVVEKHGGTLDINGGTGRGTEVKIRLPVLTDDATGQV